MRARNTLAALALGAFGAGLVPTAIAGASSPPDSAPGDYCAAHVALERAFNGDDPAAIGPAVAAAQAAVPAEIADALDGAIANSPTDGPPSPEFLDAYATVMQWVSDDCGFNELDVLAKDYSYGGIGGEEPTGITVVSLDNQGTEYHEIVLLRRDDGVTEPAEDLLALPEDEASQKVQFVGQALAAPGTVGWGLADLTPGDYIAACFIPKGTTPDVYAEALAAESSMPSDGSGPTGSVPGEGEGTPHYMLGMLVEFTVGG
jgi:hypothetical protein